MTVVLDFAVASTRKCLHTWCVTCMADCAHDDTTADSKTFCHFVWTE